MTISRIPLHGNTAIGITKRMCREYPNRVGADADYEEKKHSKGCARVYANIISQNFMRCIAVTEPAVNAELLQHRKMNKLALSPVFL